VVHLNRRTALLCLISIVLLMVHFPSVEALEKTIQWDIDSGVTGFTRYEISLTTADTWQLETRVNVTFRLTLTAKNWVHDRTETGWVRIVLSSENFIFNSGNLEGTVSLTDVGDYWEEKVSFYLPVEKVNRGQTLNISINYVLTIYEFDSVQHQSWERVGENVYDPLIASVSRPLLSTLELTILAAPIVVIVSIGGYLIYRRKRRPS